MNQDQKHAAEECIALSAAGDISFGEVVARLARVGVERYHTDYCRKETTFYSGDGGSHVVPMVHASGAVAAEFSAGEVEGSVRRTQRGEIRYPQFVAQTSAAGCVGYFVQIAGKRVQYFGRNGEVHTEWFPGAKPE